MDEYATALLSRHNDLLAKIAKLYTSPDVSTNSKNLATALISVVATHTLVQINKGKSGLTKLCTECGFAYPFSTIESIEKELA
jgi:hypothetical protein